MRRRYVSPAVGTILPAMPNETVDNPGPNASLDQQNQWEQAQAQDKAFTANGVRTTEWLSWFWNSWYENYSDGRLFGPKGQGDPDAPAPVPPPGKVVQVKATEEGGAVLNFDIVDGAEPVCAVPAYPKIPAPQHYK